MEYAVAASLALTMILFLSYPRFESSTAVQDLSPKINILVQDIPQTEQFKRPPAPPRPAMPIESENENLLDDVTIDENVDMKGFDFSELSPPPAPPVEEEEIPPFLPLEDQPKIIGGLQELQKYLRYPDVARKAGIEGTVVITALIGKDGKVEETRVVKSLGLGCDEEAVSVISERLKFTPAMQRGKPVKFWFSIPIQFILKERQ